MSQATTIPAPVPSPVEGRLQGLRRALLRGGIGTVALAYLVIVVLLTIFAPLVAPHDPLAQDLLSARIPPVWGGGTWTNVLGTDSFGRDLLSRLIYGGQVSLMVSLIAATIAMVVGTLAGLAAGYLEGPVGAFIMGLADVKFSLPFYVIAISVAATVGPGATNLVILLSVWGWPNYARTVAVTAAQTKRLDYVAASRMQGAGTFRILLVHILPRCMSIVVILWSGMVGSYILVESAMSFIGLGVQVPTFSWGSMLAGAQTEMRTAWWIAVFPGLALTSVIISVFLVGDLLRDNLDPAAAKDLK